MATVLREEEIANGVSFLTHPKVKDADISQKVSFLQKKVLWSISIERCLHIVHNQMHVS
jgi:hypothetical protein